MRSVQFKSKYYLCSTMIVLYLTILFFREKLVLWQIALSQKKKCLSNSIIYLFTKDQQKDCLISCSFTRNQSNNKIFWPEIDTTFIFSLDTFFQIKNAPSRRDRSTVTHKGFLKGKTSKNFLSQADFLYDSSVSNTKPEDYHCRTEVVL